MSPRSRYANLCKLVGENEEVILSRMVKAVPTDPDSAGNPQFKFDVGSEINEKELKGFLKKQVSLLVSLVDCNFFSFVCQWSSLSIQNVH